MNRSYEESSSPMALSGQGGNPEHGTPESSDGNELPQEARSGERATQGRRRGWLLTPKPVLVHVLMAILGLQFLAVAIYTIDGVIQLILGKIAHVSVALALIVFTGLLAWFLWALMRGVALRRPWVRGPAVTISIFVLLVGVSLIQGAFWVPGISLIVLGAATVGILVSPPVVSYVGTRELAQD